MGLGLFMMRAKWALGPLSSGSRSKDYGTHRFELPPSLFEFELIGFHYKIVGLSSSIVAKKI